MGQGSFPPSPPSVDLRFSEVASRVSVDFSPTSLKDTEVPSFQPLIDDNAYYRISLTQKGLHDGEGEREFVLEIHFAWCVER